jgi:hypothetical protein
MNLWFLYSTRLQRVYSYAVHKIPNSVVCCLFGFFAVFCDFYAVYGTYKSVTLCKTKGRTDRYDLHIRRYFYWLWWAKTMSQNCGHQRAYCLSPGWYVNVESHGNDDAGWGYSWLVHQSSLAVLPAETSGASRRNGLRIENFSYQYLKYFKRSLTCR